MGRFRAASYAKALHEVVLSSAPEREEGVTTDLERLSQAFAAVPDLHRVLVTPVVAPDVKAAILEEVLDELGIEEPTRRFCHVVQRHYRTGHLDEILRAYRNLVDRRHGRIRARVEMAAPAEESERRAIVEALSRVTESAVFAEFEQAPELLAGFRATVGSRVFDGSLVGQLEQLRRRITSEQFQ
jgi:F-type H+-transporting ATPase subunit delta